jgi:chitinase
VQAFITAGVPAAKLLMGVPFYGYGWTRVPDVDGGAFQEGTPVRGDRPYHYIQSLIAGSKVYRDPVSDTPWLFDGDTFWTFDDATSIGAKAGYAVDHGLGGLMIWELSEDTPQGMLLNAARQRLSRATQ